MKVWPLKRSDVPVISFSIFVKHMVKGQKRVYYKSQICHQQRPKSFPSKLETITNQNTPLQD